MIPYVQIERCVVTKGEWLQVRMDSYEKKKMKRLAKKFGMEMSELVRVMISYIEWNIVMFEMYLRMDD